MVFQDYALYPHKTVYENMAFGLRLRKRPDDEIRTRVGAAAAILQIEHLLERKPRELSGGQRQRVAMGRAIVRQPKAFLFDEPLSNLDALLRAEMRVEIKKLHQKLGNTIVYVTHDQVEAMTLADRIVVLQAGRLVQFDTPDGIYNRPAAKFVAGFTGSPPMNFLPARVGEGGRTLHLAGGVDLPVPAPRVAGCARHIGRAVHFGLRPEDIGVANGASAASARVGGRVVLIEPLGSDTLGLVRLGTGADAGEMTGRFPPDAPLKVGEPIEVALALDKFHLFDPETGVAIRGEDW
jgi:multiple sugar transport system ATP-binding protein